MTIADTISAVLAGLTFIGIIVALGLGLYTIRETRNLQKWSHRDKLLNEIIDWANSVSSCYMITAIKDLPSLDLATKDLHTMKTHWTITVGNLQHEFEKAWNRGRYIQNIAAVFDKELQDAVNELMKTLNVDDDFCDKYRIGFDEPTSYDEYKLLLNKWAAEVNEHCANDLDVIGKVISAATTIKTKVFE